MIPLYQIDSAKDDVHALSETQSLNLQKADLRGANLQRLNLQRADLRGANLRGANLQRADFRGANLRGANLQRADLQRADLRGVHLREADLQEADLRGANLQGVDFQGVHLQGADLRGADLRGADLRGAKGIQALAWTDHGYLVYAVQQISGDWRIHSGCRDFGLDEARAHWSAPDYHTPSSGQRVVLMLEWFQTQLRKE